MACNPPSGSAPSLEERDIVVTFFSCPGGPAPSQCTCDAIVEQFWAGRDGEKPIVIAVPGGDNYVNFVSQNTQTVCVNGKFVQSFLNPFIFKYLASKNKGIKPRRIALIGFSTGCNGVRRVLHNDFDRNLVDFVYACDGTTGAYGYAQTDNPDSIIMEDASGLGLSPWVKFALQATQADPATGVPAKCMVITHTNIDYLVANRKSSSTRSGAERIIKEVISAGNVSGACIIPKALVGADKEGIERPGDVWTSQWNFCGGGVPGAGCPGGGSCPCPDGIPDLWPVEYYKILGNLIVVGFNASTERTGLSAQSRSEPAHIFQSWWVHRQVWKDVLSPRWETACEHWVAPPDDPSLSGAPGEVVRSSTVLVSSVTNPKTFIKRGRINKLIPSPGLLGLGEGETLESCGVEGVISNIFDADQLRELRNRALLIPAILVGGVLVAVAYWWTKQS